MAKAIFTAVMMAVAIVTANMVPATPAEAGGCGYRNGVKAMLCHMKRDRGWYASSLGKTYGRPRYGVSRYGGWNVPHGGYLYRRPGTMRGGVIGNGGYAVRPPPKLRVIIAPPPTRDAYRCIVGGRTGWCFQPE